MTDNFEVQEGVHFAPRPGRRWLRFAAAGAAAGAISITALLGLDGSSGRMSDDIEAEAAEVRQAPYDHVTQGTTAKDGKTIAYEAGIITTCTEDKDLTRLRLQIDMAVDQWGDSTGPAGWRFSHDYVTVQGCRTALEMVYAEQPGDTGESPPLMIAAAAQSLQKAREGKNPDQLAAVAAQNHDFIASSRAAGAEALLVPPPPQTTAAP